MSDKKLASAKTESGTAPARRLPHHGQWRQTPPPAKKHGLQPRYLVRGAATCPRLARLLALLPQPTACEEENKSARPDLLDGDCRSKGVLRQLTQATGAASQKLTTLPIEHALVKSYAWKHAQQKLADIRWSTCRVEPPDRYFHLTKWEKTSAVRS